MKLKDMIRRMLRPAGRPLEPGSLPVEGRMPEFPAGSAWLNSPPLDRQTLAGKVVLVDFWTFSCINCLRTLPYLRAWQAAYGGSRFTVIGVHTPEFEFEKDVEGVKRAIADYGVNYPVVLDNDYLLWNAYRNHYWPAHYFVDGRGDIRYRHFGEGAYDHSESVIRALLTEAGAAPAAAEVSPGVIVETDFSKVGTPETYLGFDRQEYLGSPESVRPNTVQRYSSVPAPAVNVFYFEGLWEVRPEFAVPREAGARLFYRFRAPRAYLVASGGPAGARAEIRLDGQPLTEKTAGADVELSDGRSYVTFREGRMYRLVGGRNGDPERLLELSFESAGPELYAFTFG